MGLIDLASPAFWADPFPTYRRLREESPITWVDEIQSWLIARYKDVFAALDDPRLSVAYTDWFYLGLPDDMLRRLEPFRRALKTTIVFSDPPAHERMRGLLRKSFTPELVERVRGRAAAVVAELLERGKVGDRIDLARDFAPVLPATILAAELGAGGPDVARLISWSRDLLHFFGRIPNDLGPAERVLQMYDEASACFRGLFETGRADPRDNLLTPLLRADGSEDEMTEDELFMICMALLVAGIETTANLICHAVWAFSLNPGQLARLRREPALLPSAVEEVVRYAGPVQATFRLAREDLEIEGRRILAGQRVALLLGSANRDPDRFPDADTMDIGREGARHVGFGYGRHFCAGAQIARILGQAAFEALFLRHADIRAITDPFPWEPNLVHRGMRELVVSLDTAPSPA